ncbi:MAG: hypothetical protein KAG89_06095 [Fulvimarina manganoxydans]|uniref:hypothetical protein n=1 Tax=Fulvimarina manganoxydans TaxID=937218 RepID=UPI0023526FD2|nr:hypothetical protein [Fulvimarina manganoxydans]MCK5931725.1 hypothetical protein [Fulvimarina manganoxydans]
MSNAPDKFDNQQNQSDVQDRDQDLGYRKQAPKARPSQDNAFDRPGSVDPQGAEIERRPAEALEAGDESDQGRS